MNFIFSSVALLNVHTVVNDFANTVRNISSNQLYIHDNENYGNYSFLSYGFNPVAHSPQYGGYVSACTEANDSDSLLHIYKQQGHNIGKWLLLEGGYSPKSSCILADIETSILWVFSDVSASNPVWYSFVDSNEQPLNFAVSTDLLIASRLGFPLDSFSTFGSGQIVSVNMLTGTINFVGHFQSDDESRYKQTSPNSESHIDLFAPTLLSSAMDSILASLGESSNSTTIFSEIDPLDSASQLMDCALNLLSLRSEPWLSQRAVTTAELLTFDPSQIEEYIRQSHDYNILLLILGITPS